jgi:hypothetical protein
MAAQSLDNELASRKLIPTLTEKISSLGIIRLGTRHSALSIQHSVRAILPSYKSFLCMDPVSVANAER